MPFFTLRCDKCEVEDDVFVLPNEDVDFVCAECGGELEQMVSLFAIGGVAKKPGEGAPKKRLSCCGTPRCRCAVKLTKPNPFKARLKNDAED